MLKDSLIGYPQFQTPFSSLDNAKQAIEFHKNNGTHYFENFESIN